MPKPILNHRAVLGVPWIRNQPIEVVLVDRPFERIEPGIGELGDVQAAQDFPETRRLVDRQSRLHLQAHLVDQAANCPGADLLHHLTRR